MMLTITSNMSGMKEMGPSCCLVQDMVTVIYIVQYTGCHYIHFHFVMSVLFHTVAQY